MCYLHLYLGLCFYHLTRKGLYHAPSCHLRFHPSPLHQHLLEQRLSDLYSMVGFCMCPLLLLSSQAAPMLLGVRLVGKQNDLPTNLVVANYQVSWLVVANYQATVSGVILG